MVVLSERRGHVGVITINRPDVLNAVNGEVTALVRSILSDFESEDEVSCVVITGAGNRAFCAGRDLKSIPTAPFAGRGASLSSDGFAGITGREFPKVLIAAVNGLAYGGGLELCLTCDLIVAEEHATFALSEVKHGIAAGAGGLLRLPRRIPPAIASEMVLVGEPIDASRAYSLGLVNRVVPKGEALEVAIGLADAVADNGPLAVRYSRKVLRASTDFGETVLEDAFATDHARLMESDDVSEGILAFAEKRRPRWTGK